MPTYSYACTECGHQFDVQQAFTDDALSECPQCAGQLRKVFGNVGVVFKGSGFYRNDARGDRGSGAKSSRASTPSSTSESTSTSGSTSTSDGKSSSTGSSSGSSGGTPKSTGSGGGTSTPATASA